LSDKDEAAKPLASLNELELTMNQTFRYMVHRGLLVVLVVHPFYKSCQQLSKAAAGEPVLVSVPTLVILWSMGLKSLIRSLGLLIVLIPFKLQFEIESDQAAVSLDFRRWLRNVMTWILPKSAISRLNSAVREANERNRKTIDPKYFSGTPLSMLFLQPVLAFTTILFYLPWYLVRTVARSSYTTLWAAFRLVPALLAILIVVFITGDAWKTFGLETNWRFFALIILIAGLTTAATLAALKGPEGDWRNSTGYSAGGTKLLASWASMTPARPLVISRTNPRLPIPASKDSQNRARFVKIHEANISALYAFTIISNVLAVAFWIALAFIVVGTVAISEPQTKDLSGIPAIVVMHFSLVGQSFVITRQVILVAVILGGIAALTFASGTLQDSDKRSIFTDSALADLEGALGALAYYYGIVEALLQRLHDTDALAKVGPSFSKLLSNALDQLKSSPYSDKDALPKE
jgi:hypothetical protein